MKIKSLLTGRCMLLFNITYVNYALKNYEFVKYYRYLGRNRHRI